MNDILLSIINFFYRIVPNYGVAIVLFTVFIKVCLTPLDLKSRRSMKRMSELNPKMEVLKKKYANDREKLNQKTQELYKAEKINPLSGCLPMLLTMPILFAMFGAMRHIANENLVTQFLQLINGHEVVLEPFLWIRNLWMPDNFAMSVMPSSNSLRAIDKKMWEEVIRSFQGMEPLLFANQEAFEAFRAFVASVPQTAAQSSDANKAIFEAFTKSIPDILSLPEFGEHYATVPGLSNFNLLFFRFSIFVQMNGYYVLPLLCVASQYVSQKLMPQTANVAAAAPAAGGQQQPNMGKTMMMMMPLMSLWFCTTSSAAFALYWVASSLIAAAQQLLFTRYFAWQDMKAAVAKEVGIK
ncbi:MAG: YidC/Oxa1 family membrane protein insertase [Clostridia bacterium]|nr:YidC/Oxa1 family membrane protein insertase [Clostridia bacterium]